MEKPKVISDVAVLIHAMIVRSKATRVRSKASLVVTSSCAVLAIRIDMLCIHRGTWIGPIDLAAERGIQAFHDFFRRVQKKYPCANTNSSKRLTVTGT